MGRCLGEESGTPEARALPPAVTQHTMDPTPRHKRPWAWVATGVGVGLIATGSALLATRRVDQWRRNEDTGKLESVSDAWWPGAVLAGAGAVAGGLGVWLFVKEDGERQDDEGGSNVTLNLSPTGTGLALSGSF